MRKSFRHLLLNLFLVSVGDSKGVCYWSVPKMAKKCNMCPTTCRNTLKSLEEKGYIDITQRFLKMHIKLISTQFIKYSVPTVRTDDK